MTSVPTKSNEKRLWLLFILLASLFPLFLWDAFALPDSVPDFVLNEWYFSELKEKRGYGFVSKREQNKEKLSQNKKKQIVGISYSASLLGITFANLGCELSDYPKTP